MSIYKLKFPETLRGEDVVVFGEYDSIRKMASLEKITTPDGNPVMVDGNSEELLSLVEAVILAAYECAQQEADIEKNGGN